MRSVLHRDRVRVRVLRLDRKGRPEGRVVDILERRKTPIIGRLLHEGGQWVVAPEDSRYGQDILIPKNATASAAVGQVVSVDLTEPPSLHSQPVGRVAEVLGEIDDAGMEIEIAVRKYEVPHQFSPETLAAAKASPHLEALRKKGVEVILLADRVDEWLMSNLHEFDGKPLKSVAKGGLDLGALEDEAEKAAQKEAEDAMKPLVERIKITLDERVKYVRVTHRLTDSPACLVTGEGDMSANLERLLKAAGASHLACGDPARSAQAYAQAHALARADADILYFWAQAEGLMGQGAAAAALARQAAGLVKAFPHKWPGLLAWCDELMAQIESAPSVHPEPKPIPNP
jgi:hypothetical protein